MQCELADRRTGHSLYCTSKYKYVATTVTLHRTRTVLYSALLPKSLRACLQARGMGLDRGPNERLSPG